MKAIRWLACVLALATLALATIGLLGLRSAAPVAAGDTLVVDDDGQGSASNCDSGDVAYSTIQAAIDAAIAGDTISVCPGTYDQDEANARDPDTGGAGSNDFNIFVGKAVIIQGVDASGAPITDYNDVEAHVTAKRELPTFGQSAIFVQADGVTITGLEVTGWSGTENNKTVEVVGDDVTIKDCVLHGMDSAAALYFDDRHFDPGTNTSHLQSYHVEENLIDGGGIWPSGIRFSNGAGWSGPVSGRVIKDNTFQDNCDAIAFVGPQADLWDVYPVGDATITGNSFSTSDRRHVIAWGEYPVGSGNPGYVNLDWDGIVENNTFDKAAIIWTPGGDARSWDVPPQFKNVRGIYSAIQRYAIPKAQSGDTIEVLPGTYVESGQIVINKNLSMVGAGASTTIIKPAGDTGSSGDARGWFLVNSGVTFNLSGVTLDGTGRNVYQGIRHLGAGTISDCVFSNIKYPGYMGVGMAVMGPSGMNVDVTNCTFTEMGRIGVIYFGAGVTGTFSGNTYIGKGDGDWLDYAVEVGGGANATITNNTISGNTGIASSDGSTSAGVLVTTYFGGGTQATITENFISGSTTGVAVGYDGADTSVAIVFNNSLTGNGKGVESTAPVVDASANWWGTNTPAGVAGQVSASVDYTPWLDSSADTDAGTPGFQGDFSTLDVDDDSPQTGATGRIQEGVNLVSGSTVKVAAGTYTEQLDIGKPLTLTGAGQASTIVKSPAALATKFSNNKPVVYIHDATGVTVQQLTVDGDGKGNANYRMEGVAFYNAGGTVDHVTITRVRETPLSGAQHGVALYAYNVDGVPRTLNISNNTIDEYQKNGMALSGAGLTTTVTDNTVTGSGPTGVTAQNGIQVGFGAAGTVEDNTVANVSYTGDYYGASGILVTSYSALGYPPPPPMSPATL